MVAINDLPNEVLIKIFEKVTIADLKRIPEVCCRWHAVIDEAVGIFMYIGAKSSLWTEEPFEPTPSSIGQMGIQYLAVSNLHQINGGKIPAFRNSYLLKELWLDNFIYPEGLRKILSPLENLRCLAFHISTLNHYSFKRERIELKLPQLISFSISQYGVGPEEFFHAYDGFQIIENLLYLLQTSVWPHLTSASLHLPLILDGEDIILNAVVNFIVHHKWSLQKLLVSFEFSTALAQVPFPFQQGPPYFTRDLVGLRLKKFFVHCTRRDREAMAVFDKILECQTQSLQKVHFTTGFHTIPLAVIDKNWISLLTFEMSVNTAAAAGMGGPMNLELLGKCTSLKILTLVGPIKTEQVANQEGEAQAPQEQAPLTSTRPDLRKLKKLPKSLESVRIFNLFIKSKDAAHIVLDLPKLKVVNLHGIGCGGELGLSLDSFASMIQRKQIQYFSTILGFNSTSLLDNSRNEQAPLKCLAGLLLKSIMSIGFVLYMDGNGDYVYGESHEAVPAAIDHRIIIDHEANVDFAIENDDLFENEDEENLGGGGGVGGMMGDDEDDEDDDDDFDDFDEWNEDFGDDDDFPDHAFGGDNLMLNEEEGDMDSQDEEDEDQFYDAQVAALAPEPVVLQVNGNAEEELLAEMINAMDLGPQASGAGGGGGDSTPAATNLNGSTSTTSSSSSSEWETAEEDVGGPEV